MDTLSPAVIESFNLALQKLTSHKRRAYAAELAITYFDGSSRKTERALAVSRQSENLLDRQFSVDQPAEVWVSDITGPQWLTLKLPEGGCI